MKTPICDFVRNYAKSNALRLHMPGHKGKNYIGMETLDITEIDGADSLYEAEGIIRESEKNAGVLFGAETFYSTEGSSLCIRAMLYLALLDAKAKERKPVIYACRNAHKAFITAAALLDFEVEWIYNDEEKMYLSCNINADKLGRILSEAKEKPAAVYVTSPDYLGGMTDIEAISKICRKHGVLLLVDNAHGAYLKFLSKSQHPMDLGADMCCDSAHKTLPVLTGGAYLHVAENMSPDIKKRVKDALALFGSTSPSYLILQSLDEANRYINNGYAQKLEKFIPRLNSMKKRLADKGFGMAGEEPLKLTLSTKTYGYRGHEFAAELAKHNIVCEFCDPDFVVLMFTPEVESEELERLEEVINNIPKRERISEECPQIPRAERVMTIREAYLAETEEVLLSECCGRVNASINVSCPPAVPIVVCGERINSETVKCLEYYGTEKCMVVKQNIDIEQ